MDEIGANVRQARLGLGLSKDALAAAVRYANGTMIDQIEKGLKQPSTQQLQALAKALGVTVSDLVGDKVPCGVTNNANGDHQTVYQHVEGGLMGDGAERTIRTVVREELERSRELLMQEVRAVIREAVREADGEREGEGEP